MEPREKQKTGPSDAPPAGMPDKDGRDPAVDEPSDAPPQAVRGRSPDPVHPRAEVAVALNPNQTHDFLGGASRALASTLDYESTLLTVAGMALPYLGSWSIVDVATDEGGMRRVGIIHPDPRKQEHAQRLGSSWPPHRDDPLGLPRAMVTRRSDVVPRVTDEMLVHVARSDENLAHLRALGIGSILVVPLIAREHVLGAITFISADVGHQYTEADIELAEDVAARCAMALDNARLFRTVEAARAEAHEARSRAAQLNEQLVISSIRQQELAEEARDANLAKSKFLTMMSHEIRTPINGIIGYADLIAHEISGPTTPKQREYLARMKASSDHLITLIDEVLDFAKLESGRLQLDRDRFPACESVAAAVAMIMPQARSVAIDVRIECVEPNAFFLGDEDRVRQILVILLSNALKFTDRGGRVTLRCGTTLKPDPTATLLQGGPWTFILVEDTGVGIAAKDQAAVFDAFVQVGSDEAQKKGTGLGLAIAREFARRMGGDLTLASELGEGARFTLWLQGVADPGGEGGGEGERERAEGANEVG